MSALTLSVKATFENHAYPFSATPTLTGAKINYTRQTIGFAVEEQLGKGDLPGGVECIVKNLDDTNFITLGGATGVRPIQLKAGRVGVYNFSSGDFFAQADTANVEVEFVMLSDAAES